MESKPTTVIVIPDAGDSPGTEIWYVTRLKRYYQRVHHQKLNIIVFAHDCTSKSRLNIFASTLVQVRLFANEYLQDLENSQVEIHAQGGLGAYVAYEFLQCCPEKLTRVFMIGGAPSDAMTSAAKFFHRSFIRGWYRFNWLIPFFADDPNPGNDETIAKIKTSSTECMRANPTLYRNQLLQISEWQIPKDWQVPTGCEVYFVPNGQTVRPKWWDNTYNNKRAQKIWASHGVKSTDVPGDNFSFYSLMPARALFKVMDLVRAIPC